MKSRCKYEKLCFCQIMRALVFLLPKILGLLVTEVCYMEVATLVALVDGACLLVLLLHLADAGIGILPCVEDALAARTIVVLFRIA